MREKTIRLEDMRGRPAGRLVWAAEAARDDGQVTWLTEDGQPVAAIVPAGLVPGAP